MIKRFIDSDNSNYAMYAFLHTLITAREKT